MSEHPISCLHEGEWVKVHLTQEALLKGQDEIIERQKEFGKKMFVDNGNSCIQTQLNELKNYSLELKSSKIRERMNDVEEAIEKLVSYQKTINNILLIVGTPIVLAIIAGICRWIYILFINHPL